jgi:hypothetical protein
LLEQQSAASTGVPGAWRFSELMNVNTGPLFPARVEAAEFAANWRFRAGYCLRAGEADIP